MSLALDPLPRDRTEARGLAGERALFAAAMAVALAGLGAIGWPMLGRRVYVNDDLGIFHLPLRAFYADSLARGESFLWMPGIFSGFYLHGEGQAGLLHPLHLFLYRALPLDVAFNLELLLGYVALLAGTFLFLRRQGLGRDAACFGAVGFAFSGFNLGHFVHPNMVAVLAHAPWLLVALDRALCAREPRTVARAKLAVGLLTASQWLLGHPQAAWLSAVLEGLFVLYRRPDWRPGGAWAVAQAKGLGLLAGAVQLLPTWEVLSQSERTARHAPFRHSLEPANLLQLVAPYLGRTRVFGTRFAQEFALYAGATASVLVPWLVARRRRLGAWTPVATAALLLAALSLVLALGRYGFLYRVQAALPFVGRFENSARYIALLHFALAVLGAVGLAHLAALVRDRQRLPWRELWPLALAPALGVVVAAGALALGARPTLAPAASSQLAAPARVLLGPVLLVLAALLVGMAARGRAWALPLVVVFAAADLVVYGLGFVRAPVPPVALAQVVGGQAPPPDTAAPRVQSSNNILTMRGVRLAGGYAAFPPRRRLDPLDPARLRLAGVGWVQEQVPWGTGRVAGSREDPAGEVRVTYDALGRPSSWRRVPRPMPRAWLVVRARASRDERQDVGGLDLASEALLPEPPSLAGGPAGTVAVTLDRPGRLHLRTRAASRQLLVVSEAWHEGWRATVDGAGAPVHRVNGDFLGCVLEGGEHDVRLTFRPQSFRRGALLSAGALALMGGAYVLAAGRGR